MHPPWLRVLLLTEWNWTGPCEKWTYHIDEQRRLSGACTSTQSRQSLRCLLKQYGQLEQVLDKKSRGSSPTHWLRVRIWRITKVPFVVRWLRYMSKSVTGSMLYIWYASQIKRTIKLYAGMIKHYLNGYNHLTLYVKASRVFQVSWPDLGLALTLNIIFWILSKQAYTCPRINRIAVNPM